MVYHMKDKIKIDINGSIEDSVTGICHYTLGIMVVALIFLPLIFLWFVPGMAEWFRPTLEEKYGVSRGKYTNLPLVARKIKKIQSALWTVAILWTVIWTVAIILSYNSGYAN